MRVQLLPAIAVWLVCLAALVSPSQAGAGVAQYTEKTSGNGAAASSALKTDGDSGRSTIQNNEDGERHLRTVVTDKRDSRSLQATPTKKVTRSPTKRPTIFSKSPTKRPTIVTQTPTKRGPSNAPTKKTTKSPTKKPTIFSHSPTKRPTKLTESPTKRVTNAPTKRLPSEAPTRKTTAAPTKRPTFLAPTKRPSKQPTTPPTSSSPTRRPSKAPTFKPTRRPTNEPTKKPTTASPTTRPPSHVPTKHPTPSPTAFPSPACPELRCGWNKCMPFGGQCCDAANGIYCMTGTCLKLTSTAYDCCANGICGNKCCPCKSTEKVCGTACIDKNAICCEQGGNSVCPTNSVCAINAVNSGSQAKMCMSCGSRGVCGGACCSCNGTASGSLNCDGLTPQCCKRTVSNPFIWTCATMMSTCCPDGGSCGTAPGQDCCNTGR